MPAWTNIANADIDQDSPVTQPLMTALRDNPIAMSEGAAGSPSILPNIAAYANSGGVGTYIWARATSGGDVLSGSTVAGSTLVPTGALSETTGSAAVNTAGVALTGTWRCMGRFTRFPDPLDSAVTGGTLWLRTV